MEDKAVPEKVYKIAIAVPCGGFTAPESYDNHLTIMYHIGKMEESWKRDKRNPRYEFYFYKVGRLLTAMAREKLIEVSMTNKMDYIIMYDDDMLLPIDMFEALLYDIEEHPEIDILAPLAFMRNAPHYPVIYNSIEGYDSQRHQSYYKNEFVKNYPREKLVECDAVGFGAVLINMRIFTKMTPPFFFSTTGTGEDIYACIKAKKEAGARVFMDTRIKLGHLGTPKIIDEDYRDNFVKENKEDILDIPTKYNYDK